MRLSIARGEKRTRNQEEGIMNNPGTITPARQPVGSGKATAESGSEVMP
jgi:hypothetical protein